MAAAPPVDFTSPPAVSLDLRLPAGERLNVVLPHLDARRAFGGIATAMELARVLAGHYPRVRMVSQMPLPSAADMFDIPVPGRDDSPGGPPPDGPARMESSPGAVSPPWSGVRREAVSLATGAPLPCHQAEVFLCTHWSTVGVWESYDQAMSRVGRTAPDYYSFIQDFEPDFLPQGPARDRALAGLARGERCRAVINSGELAGFLSGAGYRFAETHILKPSLNPELSGYLNARAWRLSKPRPNPLVVLVYGRPATPRNRFEEAVRGLALFLERLPEGERRQIVCLSVGQSHQDILLAPGAVLRSLGKLSLARYAALLEQAHVGLSLMASPHPSYPPLEMALFGLMTVTNRHEGKDLAGTHPGIVSVARPEPEEVARGLALAWEMALGAPSSIKAVLPASLNPLPWNENLRGLRIDPIRAPGHNSDGTV
jgi:hypothetical protein